MPRRVVADVLSSDETGDRPIDQPERGPATQDAALPQRTRVDVDTWIDRPDLAAGNRTFVAAGDQIPVGLEGYSRTAA